MTEAHASAQVKESHTATPRGTDACYFMWPLGIFGILELRLEKV